MILVDTSVWVDHLRKRDPALVNLLRKGEALSHPFVVGELALGYLRQKDNVLNTLSNLPTATVASDDEVRHLIDRESLFGLGIGYVDAHLLAATRLTANASIWTRDKRLASVSERLSLGVLDL